jgi:hypothetical protein
LDVAAAGAVVASGALVAAGAAAGLVGTAGVGCAHDDTTSNTMIGMMMTKFHSLRISHSPYPRISI